MCCERPSNMHGKETLGPSSAAPNTALLLPGDC